MNIRELADQAGLKEAVLLRVYGTEDALCDSEIAVLRQIEKFAELVVAHEREECAKLCEAEADDGSEGEWDGCCLSLANKIRARGEA